MNDLHEIWSHRWITPKAKSTESRIDRLGVVATDNIKKGETVAVLGGVVVPKTQIGSYWEKMGHVGIQIDDDFFIVPTNREELKKTAVFNHSCNPTCGFSNSLALVAIQDINTGEELTFDYAFCESVIDEFSCNCSSENCRGIIKPTDWKDRKIQNVYGAYYSPYLRKKF